MQLRPEYSGKTLGRLSGVKSAGRALVGPTWGEVAACEVREAEKLVENTLQRDALLEGGSMMN